MTRIIALFLAFAAFNSLAEAQRPVTREARLRDEQPIVRYSLAVDSSDLSGFTVTLRIRNAPDTFRLALAAHPEYDDKYYRFVENLRIEAGQGKASITREDSALWRAVAPGGESVVSYRIRLPANEGPSRAAWRPSLAPSGGLVGGPHAFMYVLGSTLAPSHVTLDLPAGWKIATGLEPTSDPRTFFAPSTVTLIDSPVLIGRFRSWLFSVDGVPHRVVYWPLPNATAFDTAAFVGSLERLAQQAVSLFGRAPYREYTFLFQDGAYGGLEHMNSVTLGAPSAELAKSSVDILHETAHEYVHTWNLMRIHPAERGVVDYKPNGQTRGLWFSEGFTMYYADLIPRRAGLAVHDSTRIAHLESLMRRYYFSPGNSRISPERASLAEYGAPPGSLGDYDPSPHLQGELLGAMLDLIVRNSTDGRRSLDDVMRAMLARFSGERGFTGPDIERTVAEVCACNVKSFFRKHVREGLPIDFDRYLSLIGLRSSVRWVPAVGNEGKPIADWRIRAWQPGGETRLRLLLTDPKSVWGRAGLHTGDRVISLNGTPVTTWPEFRAVTRRAQIGDTVRVEVERPAGPWRTTVVVSGYEQPVVTIEEIAGATTRQREMRDRWLNGEP